MSRHRVGSVQENAYALATRQNFVGAAAASSSVRLRLATQ
jgi:hypothetical protein